MDLTTFEELTGQTVSDSQRAVVSAQIGRTQSILENALGFTLDPDKVTDNLYAESGKTSSDWSWSGDFGTLLDPDEVVGAYRVFNYDIRDRLLHVDPYSELHAVKLVVGDVTVHTFDPEYYSTYDGRGGVRKYISVAPTWWSAYSWFERVRDVQLAVDADWLWDADVLPDDLLYLWADSAKHLADPSRLVKSENRGTRSYTKFDAKPPLQDPVNQTILARYAGPHGTAGRLPV